MPELKLHGTKYGYLFSHPDKEAIKEENMSGGNYVNTKTTSSLHDVHGSFELSVILPFLNRKRQTRPEISAGKIGFYL